MRRPARRSWFPHAAALATLLAAGASHGQAQPRYLTQMQAELQAMGLSPQCAAASAQAGSCTIRAAGAPVAPGASAPPADARRFLVTLQYNDATDTIYAYVDHYATLRADAPNSAAAFRRLLEMNWEMLASRFEWSSASGEVRLSAVLNTDSNFDRRAFRGVVRALLRMADRYADEVAQLTGGPVGERAPTPTPSAAGGAPATRPAAPADAGVRDR